MVNIKIHRGTSQIGGTITEIYTENTHIFIDFGSEITVNPEDSTDGKMIDMIKCAECDAVLFSHYCQTADYLGRFPQIISDGNTCHSLRSMRQKHIISGVTADYRGLISVQLWLD